jgi:hypothetical protein
MMGSGEMCVTAKGGSVSNKYAPEINMIEY